MLQGKYRRAICLLAFDLAAIALGYYAAYWLRLELALGDLGRYEAVFRATLPWLLGARLVCGLWSGLYVWSFRHASLNEAMAVVGATIVGSMIFVGLCQIAPTPLPPPRSVYALEFGWTLLTLLAVRFLPRYLNQLYLRRLGPPTGAAPLRTLIFGAGGTAELLVRDILRTRFYPYLLTGMIDDDRNKWGTTVHGCRVLGGLEELPDLIRRHEIQNILIAVPNLPAARLRRLLDLCAGAQVRFKLVPQFAELIAASSQPIALRDLKPEHLLERTPVTFAPERLAAGFVGRTVLVTGAGGSIGAELCRQLAGLPLRRLVALDLNESELYLLRLDLQAQHPGLDFRLEIGSVRDRARLDEIFAAHRPQLCFHAAAHKHVPLMEECPAEALKNNVLGTLQTAQCAAAAGAERFVLISTDKAVRPANVMGASKRLAELIVRQVGRQSATRFISVRFGNVLGSSGSLLPILQRQIERGGPVTVTHPEITRYFMTIPEAVGLVLVAAVQNEGDTCVLDMGEPLNIDKLARELISLSGHAPDRDIAIIHTGLRPGEKMHEELFFGREKLRPSAHPKIRLAEEETPEMDLAGLEAELQAAAAHNDLAQVQEFLRRRLPEYRAAET